MGAGGVKCGTKPTNVKPKADDKQSKPLEALSWFLHSLGFTPEVQFSGVNGKRRWRVDFMNGKVAVEYQGRGQGHQSVSGSWRDHDKITELQVCGFTAIQCNARSVNDGRCFKWIEAAMEEQA